MPAVLAALVFLMPQTLVGLFTGNLKIAALPTPPTRSGPGPWTDFRNAAGRWVSITLPIGSVSAMRIFFPDVTACKARVKKC